MLRPKLNGTSLVSSVDYRAGMILLAFSLTSIAVSAQSKWGFEQYNYIRQHDDAALVPMIHFQTKNNWYSEVRYNYEDAQTLSVFTGKTIEGGHEMEYTITPMAGFSGGRFTGISLGANTDMEWNNFYLSAQSQYSIATKKNASDFFFNWSELGYDISDHLFAGLAMQYTRQDGENIFEPGFLAGISFNKISIPVYVFNPFHSDHYLVLGLNYEYKFTPKKKSIHKKNPSYL